MNLILSNWITWLGLFTIGIVAFLMFKKPLKTKNPPGHFDNSIYTKPFFKGASLLLLLIIFGFIILQSQTI